MDPMERVLKELSKYMREHETPDMDDAERNQLTQQFMTEYNARQFDQRYGYHNATDLEDADSYVEKADQAESVEDKRKYFQKALELEPENLDAIAGMAMNSSEIIEEQIAAMEEALKKGTSFMEREGFLPDEAGYFWGIVETRPYMRMLKGYANLLLEAGHFRKSIQVMEEMLRLCPNDNIGARYTLLAVYIALEEKEQALGLYNTYLKEGGGTPGRDILKDSSMLFLLTALHYRLGELDEAERFLKTLARMNKETQKFFQDAQNREFHFLHHDGFMVNTAEELASTYTDASFLFLQMPGFIPWGLRVLSRSGGIFGSGIRKGGIRTKKPGKKRGKK